MILFFGCVSHNCCLRLSSPPRAPISGFPFLLAISWLLRCCAACSPDACEGFCRGSAFRRGGMQLDGSRLTRRLFALQRRHFDAASCFMHSWARCTVVAFKSVLTSSDMIPDFACSRGGSQFSEVYLQAYPALTLRNFSPSFRPSFSVSPQCFSPV